MPLAAHGVTHPGRRRSNEDAMLVDPAAGLFVVADGMGGHNAGEVASAIAIRTIHDTLAGEAAPTERALSNALCAANDEVLRTASREPTYTGMGTTVTAAQVVGGDVLFGNVGDSRMYLWRRGTLTQLTSDDSWLSRVLADDVLTGEDAQRHPMRHVLTKVVGLRDDLEPAVGRSAFSPGDLLILCSDGLHGPVTDEQIAQVLRSEAGVGEIAQRLVDQALAAGGTDNITVIAVRSE